MTCFPSPRAEHIPQGSWMEIVIMAELRMAVFLMKNESQFGAEEWVLDHFVLLTNCYILNGWFYFLEESKLQRFPYANISQHFRD